MAVVDLQLLDGQDRQLPEHQQWKHYTSQAVVAVEVLVMVLVAVQVVLFTTQQCH
jgi:hypothetical protein